MQPSTTRPSVIAIAMHLDVIDDCYSRIGRIVPTEETEARYVVKQLQLIEKHIGPLIEQLQDLYNLPRA